MIADQEAVEAVSGILSRVAPGGASIELSYSLVDDGLSARPDAGGPATVRAYLPGSDARGADRAVDETRRRLGHLQAFGLRPIGDLSIRPVHEEDWAAAWKRHFPVLRVGRRLVIRPTWRRHRPSPTDVVLVLDPGMAFGTGLHPTTRLCLEALESLADRGSLEGARVLDVGCGSGILGLAAVKLGAAHVLGVDTDPVAVGATTGNARRDHLTGRLVARQGSVPTGQAPFDVVLANLIASLLMSLASELAAEVRPGGRLLASGIFLDRESEASRALGEAGLHIVGRKAETDWVALEAVRQPADVGRP